MASQWSILLQGSYLPPTRNFLIPLVKGLTGAFDIHVYYFQERQVQKDFAKSLWERIRRECMSIENRCNCVCMGAINRTCGY